MKIINTATNTEIVNTNTTKTVRIPDGRWVEMPAMYDPSIVTGEDVEGDCALTVVEVEEVDDNTFVCASCGHRHPDSEAIHMPDPNSSDPSQDFVLMCGECSEDAA